ncbi:MAG: hypothetical protein CMK86_12995 [Pseudomonadales bacterium]|nr:hypothetical protein [Pseudomonas sp.]MBB49542.1 hypothetical protein [Pseudomonadales bacterium]MBF78786.1 hypothetical protein [Pseudomonadales bacterium]
MKLLIWNRKTAFISVWELLMPILRQRAQEEKHITFIFTLGTRNFLKLTQEVWAAYLLRFKTSPMRLGNIVRAMSL